MNIVDKNQTLEPPAGYDLCDVCAEGSYLRLAYHKNFEGRHSSLVIYLTDMGREIARTIEEYQEPQSEPEPKAYAPIARRFRFRNGWLLLLEGIREIIRCLKK